MSGGCGRWREACLLPTKQRRCRRSDVALGCSCLSGMHCRQVTSAPVRRVDSVDSAESEASSPPGRCRQRHRRRVSQCKPTATLTYSGHHLDHAAGSSRPARGGDIEPGVRPPRGPGSRPLGDAATTGVSNKPTLRRVMALARRPSASLLGMSPPADVLHHAIAAQVPVAVSHSVSSPQETWPSMHVPSLVHVHVLDLQISFSFCT